MSRRRLARLALAGLGALALGGCGNGGGWHAVELSGAPALRLAMTRVSDGRSVTEADYRGRVVLLEFGFTHCPDVCPTTLANLAAVLDDLGAEAQHVRVLFVTVDPERDTAPTLAAYVAAFRPGVDGLRGTPDQLAALARPYRILYSVRPETGDHPYDVVHSPAVFVFDASGAARLVIPTLADPAADLAGTAADLRRLIGERRVAAARSA